MLFKVCKGDTSQPSQEFRCADCNGAFNQAWLLKRHAERCTSAHPPSLCERCGRVLNNETALQRHQASCQQTFTCDHCSKTFGYKHHLQKHLTSCQQQPFTCHHCSKTLVTKHLLQRHQESCRERPRPPQDRSQNMMTCRQCGHSFPVCTMLDECLIHNSRVDHDVSIVYDFWFVSMAVVISGL